MVDSSLLTTACLLCCRHAEVCSAVLTDFFRETCLHIYYDYLWMILKVALNNKSRSTFWPQIATGSHCPVGPPTAWRGTEVGCALNQVSGNVRDPLCCFFFLASHTALMGMGHCFSVKGSNRLDVRGSCYQLNALQFGLCRWHFFIPSRGCREASQHFCSGCG